MQPSEDQIRELMGTVACAACGATYQPTSIEVLGHRDELWFLKVSCLSCNTSGLVAALVKTAEDPASRLAWTPPEPDEDASRLDAGPGLGPVTRSDVAGMRAFLKGFDGDFGRCLAGMPRGRRTRPDT